MARKRKQRRQQHGSAWHWKQTDSWYYTEPGTKKRVPLFDEKGERIRGKENRDAAQVALARVKLADELDPPVPKTSNQWTVAKVCDVYLADLHRTANPEWATQVDKWLNDLCGYCGALDVHDFQKKHLRTWLQRHTNWNHNSQRNVIGSVKAAFNFFCAFNDLDINPVAGYQKPAATPRIAAFSPNEEQAMYEAADEAFGLFIKACILTGARPYSELAKVTADHVVETPHGLYYLLKARTTDGQGGHKTGKKTGKDRRIMLCDEMERITRQLMLRAPKGSGIPLFRSTRGRQWKRCNCVQRFLTLKKKLGVDGGLTVNVQHSRRFNQPREVRPQLTVNRRRGFREANGNRFSSQTGGNCQLAEDDRIGFALSDGSGADQRDGSTSPVGLWPLGQPLLSE